MSNFAVIGGGFSGLSSACFLAKAGHSVTLFEKHDKVGGRARTLHAEGFTFDMGPSWYWMPDVAEKFFSAFDTKTSDYFDLVRLDPGFRIIFNKQEELDIPAELDDIYGVFEKIEKGSAVKLRKFLAAAEKKYNIGMNDLVYKPGLSWREFINIPVLRNALRLSIFDSVSAYVRKYFKDPRLIALMEFPSLFLGAMPDRIPALYSLMNYAALSLGTWYPMGGMGKLAEAMETLAVSLGVNIKTGCEVKRIEANQNICSAVITETGDRIPFDAVIAGNDYHHTESKLLEERFRNYDAKYWDKREMAPSCLLFYVGVKKRVPRLIHHNLFFDADLTAHAASIYREKKWPDDPLFYVCCPSKTDPSTAPPGMENLFFLLPIAAGSEDTPAFREKYFDIMIKRVEKHCGASLLNDIVYKKSYCVNDFKHDYHAYKGNAYGLANTLRQTAVLKPSIRNKKLKNLFYAGQLTVPGPGVPPAIISGRIAAEQLLRSIGKQ